MYHIKKPLYISIFIIVVQGCCYSHAMDSQIATELAYEATKAAIKENLKAVVGAGSCVGLVVNAYTLSKDIKSYVSPSEEEQANAREIDKQLELLELKQSLRACLISNRKNTNMSSLRVPTVCDELAFALGILGARDEVDRMTNIFTVFNK
jgi:hypothetical protein